MAPRVLEEASYGRHGWSSGVFARSHFIHEEASYKESDSAGNRIGSVVSDAVGKIVQGENYIGSFVKDFLSESLDSQQQQDSEQTQTPSSFKEKVVCLLSNLYQKAARHPDMLSNVLVSVSCLAFIILKPRTFVISILAGCVLASGKLYDSLRIPRLEDKDWTLVRRGHANNYALEKVLLTLSAFTLIAPFFTTLLNLFSVTAGFITANTFYHEFAERREARGRL